MAKIIQKKELILMKLLKSGSTLQGVKEETIRRMYELGIAREYDKGESIFHAKEKVDFVCFLLSGKVIEYNMTHQGKRKILFVLGPGALLNDYIFTRHTPAVYCDTIEACTVLLIQNERFIELMQDDCSLSLALVRDQEKKYQRLIHQLKNSVGNMNLDRKIAAKLWKLGRDFGISRGDEVEIDVNLSVTLLADMLGTSREATSRLLKNMIENGLIRHEKKRIIIHDIKKLSHFYKTGDS